MDKIELKENERIDDLEFENLKIIQNTTGFCFGIDSVLLSDYSKNIKKGSTVVDIGTGTGIISILLSKKSSVDKIYGVEIQEDVAEMAKRSVKLNSLEGKIEIINSNIKDIFEKLNPNSIDAIVTNPPYMKLNTGAKSEEKKKLISRHEVECSLEDIIKISYRLLKSKGEFYMVHRAERIVDILYLLRNYRIEPKSIRFIQSYINKAPNLVLIKAIKDAGEKLTVETPLIVYNTDGTYTDEILKIYNKKV
jgi:tRNA1Val (adenine37-N6)-methyltransferase